ncbi:protein-glutamate O-methyltransferase CheR [Ideonella sp. A 288]|uniref:CheR family methyltransferase n=1 Tax=Ideonella sp. A 288 TaxID=1962181 RepID=UPI000B4BB6EB|nr:CheR family methyltransferase [Ideonella sp. A 288]
MTLSTPSFTAVTDLFHRVSGIRLSDAKRSLVTGRLQKLAAEAGIPDLDRYVEHVVAGRDADETRRVIDRLTTNETYFFREPQHFDLLADLARKPRHGATFRVWSAASSSGEEAFSIAMVLAEHIGPRGWEVVGTDLSTAMVDSARRALFPIDRVRDTPTALVKKYCLRGQGDYQGQVLMAKELRQNMRFDQANLTEALPDIGLFDVIFLRNVLIYFDPPSKAKIVRRVIEKLKPGALLFTGHAESLSGQDVGLRASRPAVYERN